MIKEENKINIFDDDYCIIVPKGWKEKNMLVIENNIKIRLKSAINIKLIKVEIEEEIKRIEQK